MIRRMRLVEIALFSMVAWTGVKAQVHNPRFQHLQIEDGLSQTTVRCVLQDSRGFMWFGTQDGLNRYDGYDIEVYVSDQTSPTSLSSDDILVLFEDRNGTLWVGTADGLNRFERPLESFTRFQHAPDNTASLSHNHVTAIYEDTSGVLWIGTTGGGLNAFDRETGVFTRFQHEPGSTSSLSSNTVDIIYEDKAGRLWVGTDNGLSQLNRETGRFNRLQHNPGDPSSIGQGAVSAIREDRTGTLWVGTGAGLYAFDSQTPGFTRYEHDPEDPSSMGAGPVTAIVEGNGGDIWVGTDGGGLHLLNRSSGRFQHFMHDPYRSESLVDDRVLAIHRDRTGALWVGTSRGGVDRHDPNSTKFSVSHSQPALPDGFSDYIRSFFVDRYGDLWIGTEGNGLTRVNRETGARTNFRHDPNDPGSLANDRVFSLHEDRSGVLWIGAFAGGFSRFDRQSDTFVHYELPLPRVSSVRTNSVRVIHEDRSGMMWLGTQGGGVIHFDGATGEGKEYERSAGIADAASGGRVFAIIEDRAGNIWIASFGGGVEKVEAESGNVISYTHVEGDANSLSTDYVLAIHEDREGNIWIGTVGSGFDRLDPRNGSFEHYDESDGLPNSNVYGILEDDRGHLWISHNKGLSRFDPTTKEFKNYDVTDGLQSNEFNGGAYYKSSDGEMFFGGIKGYNAFYPDSIGDNTQVPQVVITDLQLYNRSVPIGPQPDGRTILSRSITETEEIALTYDDRVVSLEYAALQFDGPDMVEYAHILEGLEEDWSYVGTRRFATYTHIPHGRYVFRVRASNGDGVWNDVGDAVRITISPPIWKTTWFLTLVALSLFCGIWGFHQYRTRLIRVRANVLEQRVHERTTELEGEIVERKEVQSQLEQARDDALQATKSKSNFLATMSHEIRTPMNGVLGMVQLLMDTELDSEQLDYAEAIHTSGNSLLGIINDILDFSKVEAGKLDIEPIPFDLQVATAEVADLLTPKAAEKGIEMAVMYNPDAPRYLVGDAGRVKQIILNLAGNAVKFTDKGHVLIEVEGLPSDGETAAIKISVQDTGIGIDGVGRAKLFESFSQADSSTTRRFGGTGLGLAICKRLVELMGGEIGVESKLGEGSTFWFTMRLDHSEQKVSEPPTVKDLVNLRVLVVDDTEINRRIMREQLASLGMRPDVAASGSEALELLHSAVDEGDPYVISVLDYQMPNMNGEQLGQAIMADPLITKTRMVLVTSSGQRGDARRLQGKGFSGYLTKTTCHDTVRDVLATVASEALGTAGCAQLVTRHTVAEAQAHADGPAANESAIVERRVLLAEDNIVNQKVAKRMLEKLGCVVDIAANGKEAVEMCMQLPYEVVFMDCQMPELDGYAATGTIREREAGECHTPIVAMTANAMEGDRERCLEAGMDDYIAKPINIEDCREALERWASRREAANPAEGKVA